jgi:hypothetical protein
MPRGIFQQIAQHLREVGPVDGKAHVLRDPRLEPQARGSSWTQPSEWTRVRAVDKDGHLLDILPRS